MNEQVRELFPWPLGSHWCWHETVMAGILCVVLVVNGLAVVVFGRPRLFAVPAGLMELAMAYGCGWLIAAKKETTGSRLSTVSKRGTTDRQAREG